MKNNHLVLYLLLIFPVIIQAQDKNKFGIKFSGFVKTDIFWDSRQTVDIRDGHFMLYPKNELLDPNGEDINAKPSFNILSVQTRLKGSITGPDALGAKTSGVIEGSFFGSSNSNINSFRLRHAFVKLKWPTTELLVGQYWHPAFITSCFPYVVSFNTGAPFLPFSRNPQVRIKQSVGKVNIILTALAQRDFFSNGPYGPGTEYLRNSAVPAFNLRLEYHNKNEQTDKEFLAGITGNYKILTPRSETDSSYKTNETISSFAGTIYFKVKIPVLTVKLSGTYGQDVYNWVMLGGYAVRAITNRYKNYMDYSVINTIAAWTDIHSNGKKWQVGLFAGYTKNLGAIDKLAGPYYSRGSDIDYVYRISPRFIYNAGRFRFAPEIEYTVAAYGQTNDLGEVENSKEIGNIRLLFGVYLFF